MNPLVIAGLALFLAFVVESSVEYVLGKPMDMTPKLKPYKWLLQYAAVGVGIFTCFWYQLDLVSIVAEQAPSTLGIVFTGLLISRGADWLHKNVFGTYIKI